MKKEIEGRWWQRGKKERKRGERTRREKVKERPGEKV